MRNKTNLVSLPPTEDVAAIHGYRVYQQLKISLNKIETNDF